MKRRLSVAVVAIAVASALFLLWARGRQNLLLEGTLQFSFEESAFFPDGDCSAKPFWWQYPNALDSELSTKWQALGKPPAMRVKVRGNLTSIGMHGHLGGYWREIQPLAIIETNPASRCRWRK